MTCWSTKEFSNCTWLLDIACQNEIVDLDVPFDLTQHFVEKRYLASEKRMKQLGNWTWGTGNCRLKIHPWMIEKPSPTLEVMVMVTQQMAK